MIVKRLERDAFEHYMIIQEYASQLSTNFNCMILTSVIIGFGIIALFIYGLLSPGSDAPYLMWSWLMVECIFFLIYPIHCLAYANEATASIVRCFSQGSAPSDFEVLGGRDLWTDYL